ncbi:MAG TPA: hypothetical protein VHW23_40945 [Kofleriaceae bacterium]|jgi:hypothetical protein|nr:hypothetical protein [Kofleriaceae bacterium]
MLRNILLAAFAVLAVACHGNDPAGTGPAGGPASAGDRHTGGVQVTQVKPPDIKPDTKGAPAPSPPPPPGGHDFTPEAKALLSVGACGDVAAPQGFDPKLLAGHCEVIKKAQDDYLTQWVKPAHSFFIEHVPSDIPRKVVYPFAGGDLSTALTVYPDADEITTISLEPAGDPRDLAELKGAELDRALKKVEYELKFLYRVNFSNTMNMIDAMREGALPTQLIFGLSALKIHGFEVVGLRYFRLEADGSIHYLDDAEVAAAPSTRAKANMRNRVFANAEIQFRKPGGRVQVYRHIQWNLDNEHLKADPRILKHLESKGQIAGMTKAASYLLSWDSFSTMRDYLIGHVSWMVSDATGVAPKWGKPAGFEYETYGDFTGPHIQAGGSIAKDWRVEFESEPKRDLAFRFGYYDKHNANHLIIMRRKKA